MKAFSFLAFLALAFIMTVPVESAARYSRVLKGGEDDGPCVPTGNVCVDDSSCCVASVVCTPKAYTARVSVGPRVVYAVWAVK